MSVSAKGWTIAIFSVVLGSLTFTQLAYGDCTHARCAPPSGTERPKPAVLVTSQDTRVIPGQRVGAVTAQTTRQDLVKLYGANRLVDRTIPGPEGIGELITTRVNLGQERSFTVVWQDASKTKPADIRNLGTAWKTPEGIGVGSTLTELQQRLGEFQLFGLGWDYGGTVLLQNTKLAKYNGKLILRVAAAPNAAEKHPRAYRSVSGDQTFSSKNPNWRPLGIRIREMIVPLNANQQQ
jgi:hypothetical protein